MLVFDKRYFDNNLDLVYQDKKFNWSESPKADLFYGNHKYSIFPIMKMYDYPSPVLIEEKYIRMVV